MTIIIVVVLCLAAASFGGVARLAWSCFSEILSQMDARVDHEPAASSYGLFTASSKIGLGLSGLMTGAWVSQRGTSLAPSRSGQ